MPVQSNPAIQNVPMVAWDGATSTPGDILKFVRFGWSFRVNAAVAVDAVFNVEIAPPSVGDPCVPGTFVPAPAIPSCQGGVTVAQGQITIPAGQLVGSICSATIACKGNRFVRLTPASGGTANVTAILVRQGPKI